MKTVRGIAGVTGVAAALLALAAAMSGCNDSSVPGSSAAPPGTVAASASWPSAPSDTARAPVGAPSRAGDSPSRPLSIAEALAGARDPHHQFNEVNVKRASTELPSPAKAPPAAYMAKQADYLRKWKDLAATQPSASAEEIEAQRIALKRSTLGD
jgi:hypothetical protein